MQPITTFAQVRNATSLLELGRKARIPVKTYREIFHQYLYHPECKFAGPDGRPCDPWMRGVYCSDLHRYLLLLVLRLRPVLIRASRVLPSSPPLFQRVERHFFEGQFGGFSVSGIHLCPQTSHSATRIVFHAMTSL